MTLISSIRAYSGRVFHVDHDTVRFPTGTSGTLEMIRHPGASAIVPFLDDPVGEDPRILLIHQFRHAAGGTIWEIPAGTLVEGESPEGCAARELKEEAGVSAGNLTPLTTILTTPGFTDERIHLFLATDLTPGQAQRDEDEFLEVHTVRWSEVGRMIRTGMIVDGKTLVALMHVQCFHRGSF